MAKKRTRRVVHHVRRTRDDGEYVKSPIIRVGIVFFFIMVIILVAYAVKVYTP